MTKKLKKEVYLALIDIRGALNVGALFRTADAAGITKMYLVGYTPAPLDRFLRVRSDVAKAALGAEKTIAWEQVSDVATFFKLLKKGGVSSVALEQDKNAVNYKKVKPVFPVCFILGNEVEGLSAKVLKKVDTIAEIPMRGKKESLNVSVAGGVALFRILGI